MSNGNINDAMFYSKRNGALGPIPEWRLKDCIAVHKLLGSVLDDQDAALSKYYLDQFLFKYH
jgi:hypothetical protein